MIQGSNIGSNMFKLYIYKEIMIKDWLQVFFSDEKAKTWWNFQDFSWSRKNISWLSQALQELNNIAKNNCTKFGDKIGREWYSTRGILINDSN